MPEGIQGQRVRVGKGHESIRREALQDPRLSFKATGMLAYLLSLPDNWRTNAERLSGAKNKLGKAREGREAMQAGLRELEEAGYLLRRKYQDERGAWRWIWRYSDTPSDLHVQDVSAGQPVNGLPVDGSAEFGSPVDGSADYLEISDVEVLERDLEEQPLNSDARASCPSQADATAGDEGPGGDRGADDLFASWPDLDQEQGESQDPRTPPFANGSSTNGDSRGSNVKVKRTRRSSSRAPLPPDQAAAVASGVAGWVDDYRDGHGGTEPTEHKRGQAAREIRALIVAGNPPDRVLHAARSAGRAGYATVEQQLARMTSTNGGSRPGRVSATELPRDHWRRFVQE